MTSYKGGPRRVVFVCTGRGEHGPLKLGEWTLGADGVAAPLPRSGGSRPLVDALRELDRFAFNKTCPRCLTGPPAPADLRVNESGVRHIRATQARMNDYVRDALAREPDKRRVRRDVSTPDALS